MAGTNSTHVNYTRRARPARARGHQGSTPTAAHDLIWLQGQAGNRAVAAHVQRERTAEVDEGVTLAPAGPAVDPAPGFISDIARSTLELLPKDQRERFASIPWNDLDYPGAKYRIKNTSEANLAKWRSTPDRELFSVAGKRGRPDSWFLRGTHQADARALLGALAQVRPGGGERRVNTGGNAILTKTQFEKDPDAFDAYIVNQLIQPDGVKARGKKTMMNKHAAGKFLEMRAAAKADGVVLTIGNAFRERARAEASAASKGNPNAVASYSPHSLGLAMDLNLSTKALSVEETKTRMPNTFKGLSTPAYKWMFMRGAEFGFYQFRMEPWHWEFNPPGFAGTFWAENLALAPAAGAKRKRKRKAR